MGETIQKAIHLKIYGLKSVYFLKSLVPKINDTKNRTIKIKNKIFAIDAAPAAIPVKPNSPATIATTRKINVQRNIFF